MQLSTAIHWKLLGLLFVAVRNGTFGPRCLSLAAAFIENVSKNKGKKCDHDHRGMSCCFVKLEY